jgi:hypothetical protein
MSEKSDGQVAYETMSAEYPEAQFVPWFRLSIGQQSAWNKVVIATNTHLHARIAELNTDVSNLEMAVDHAEAIAKQEKKEVLSLHARIEELGTVLCSIKTDLHGSCTPAMRGIIDRVLDGKGGEV